MGKKEPTPKELRDGLLVAFLPMLMADLFMDVVMFRFWIGKAPWLVHRSNKT